MNFHQYPNFWNERGLFSYILYPIALILSICAAIRKIVVRTQNIGFPVICVGNASVGGTGKTQVIKGLALHYLEQGKKIVILTKGYRGRIPYPVIVDYNNDTPEDVGDEAIELSTNLARFQNHTIIKATNPAHTIHLIKKINPDLVLIDDGLQNPSFYKDFKIMMVDGERGFGNGLKIPAGPMRENSDVAIQGADIIASINPCDHIIHMFQGLEKFITIKSEINIDLSPDSRILMFCGIGNPGRFFASLRSRFDAAQEISFPDHHTYTKKDITKINSRALDFKADAVVTTAKDASKLHASSFCIPLVICNTNIIKSYIQTIAHKINEKIF